MAQRIPSGELKYHQSHACRLPNCGGFTYIGLLLMIAITGVGLSTIGLSWQYQVRLEKEQQLLFVGAQFRRAIHSYYENSPSGVKTYPLTLDELLVDHRFPNVQRHLRQIYPDPMTGKQDWGLIKQQNRIVGIYSSSKTKPIKQAGFSLSDANFIGAHSYQDWIFGQAVDTTLSK